MNVTELAREAESLFTGRGWGDNIEIAEGWRTIYNRATGQSKRVLLHVASNLVFKCWGYHDPSPVAWSQRYVCDVVLDGKMYHVRLPYFEYIECDSELIEVQEYVSGNPCDCADSWCDHAKALRRATNCFDTHRGNWAFSGEDEIVLFDFDGIQF